MRVAVGQRQKDEVSSVAEGPPALAWPNYLPAVIAAGVMAFVMGFITVLMVKAGG